MDYGRLVKHVTLWMAAFLAAIGFCQLATFLDHRHASPWIQIPSMLGVFASCGAAAFGGLFFFAVNGTKAMEQRLMSVRIGIMLALAFLAGIITVDFYAFARASYADPDKNASFLAYGSVAVGTGIYAVIATLISLWVIVRESIGSVIRMRNDQLLITLHDVGKAEVQEANDRLGIKVTASGAEVPKSMIRKFSPFYLGRHLGSSMRMAGCKQEAFDAFVFCVMDTYGFLPHEEKLFFDGLGARHDDLLKMVTQAKESAAHQLWEIRAANQTRKLLNARHQKVQRILNRLAPAEK